MKRRCEEDAKRERERSERVNYFCRFITLQFLRRFFLVAAVCVGADHRAELSFARPLDSASIYIASPSTCSRRITGAIVSFAPSPSPASPLLSVRRRVIFHSGQQMPFRFERFHGE